MFAPEVFALNCQKKNRTEERVAYALKVLERPCCVLNLQQEGSGSSTSIVMEVEAIVQGKVNR